MQLIAQHTRLVKEVAHELGFQFCGISEAGFLETEAPRLEQWLKDGKQGEMKFMDNYFDKRLDPRLLVDGAKSVVSLLYNYFPSETPVHSQGPKISKYAYGKDYHLVIKEKLHTFLQLLNERIGEINGRVFVDSAPVLEKAWAAKSGLGWIGKNANLITKQQGSYFFIAELIIDLELQPDGPLKDYCGTCTRCIEACPTQAIVEPYMVDGSKCISYLTIELKNQLPETFKGQLDNWFFGCDVCQEVCPWNRFSTPHNEPLFANHSGFLNFSEREWEEMTEDTFRKVFQHSAVKRTGFKGLKRNLQFIKPV